jgi:hypothetical protein
MSRSLWKGPYIDYKLLLELQTNYVLKEKYTLDNIKNFQLESHYSGKATFKRNLTVLPYFLKESGLVLKGFTKGKNSGGNLNFNPQGVELLFSSPHLNLKVGHLVLTKSRAVFQSRKTKAKSKKDIPRFKHKYIRSKRIPRQNAKFNLRSKDFLEERTRDGYRSTLK